MEDFRLVKINFARLCDHAMLSQDGKLSLIGIFDQMAGTTFPLVHPIAYLAYELEFAPAEIGRPAKMDVKVRDADGGEIGAFSLKVESGGAAAPTSRPILRHFLPMRNMKFEKPGTYEFAFFVGGRYDSSVRLDVHKRSS